MLLADLANATGATTNPQAQNVYNAQENKVHLEVLRNNMREQSSGMEFHAIPRADRANILKATAETMIVKGKTTKKVITALCRQSENLKANLPALIKACKGDQELATLTANLFIEKSTERKAFYKSCRIVSSEGETDRKPTKATKTKEVKPHASATKTVAQAADPKADVVMIIHGGETHVCVVNGRINLTVKGGRKEILDRQLAADVEGAHLKPTKTEKPSNGKVVANHAKVRETATK